MAQYPGTHEAQASSQYPLFSLILNLEEDNLKEQISPQISTLYKCPDSYFIEENTWISGQGTFEDIFLYTMLTASIKKRRNKFSQESFPGTQGTKKATGTAVADLPWENFS